MVAALSIQKRPRSAGAQGNGPTRLLAERFSNFCTRATATYEALTRQDDDCYPDLTPITREDLGIGSSNRCMGRRIAFGVPRRDGLFA